MKSRSSFGKPKKPSSILRLPLIIRRVQGHSMVPVLPPGTVILGLRWFRKLKPGQTVILDHAGREKIKRISEMRNEEIFVLGDHQESSTDSRHFGWVNRSDVIAKVIWPHAPQDRSEHKV